MQFTTMNPNPDIVRLENAMVEGDLFAIRCSVAEGSDPNTLIGSAKKFTALTSSVVLGKYDVVHTLLEVGADPNLPDQRGELPLNWACQLGDVEMCDILIAGGADPFHLSCDERNAFWVACSTHKPDLFDWLCERADKSRGDPQQQTEVLCLAASHGRPNALNHLLRGHVPVNGVDKKGATALHYAAREGQLKCVYVLLEHDATVDAPDAEGATPLAYSCMDDAAEVAELLIARGASVRSADEFGNTPLHICAAFGSTKCARVLLRNGADLHAKRSDDATPLQLLGGDLEFWLATKRRAGV